MIPLVKVAMPSRERLVPALERILYGGMIAEGEAVYDFERRFASQFGLPHVLATSSGTAALHLAFLLAGVQPNDEIVTTAMTAEPTNTTILQVGARPVFADVDPESGNLDPEDVAASITPRTRAICVVHYAGYPADLLALRRIADRHGLALIEDCAHALGARTADGAPIGSVGDYAIFSFQAIKHITTVDGGMLALRIGEQLPQARRLRWFGLTKGVPRTEVDIERVGFKYNMNNVTATIGLAQLDGADGLIRAHMDNGTYFDSAFASVSGFRIARRPAGASPSYWLYTLLTDDSDGAQRRLAAAGVSAAKLHRPNHLHSVFAPYRRPLPGLDAFYRSLLHIPCGWWVREADRVRIVQALS